MHGLGPSIAFSPLACLHAILNPWVIAGVVVLTFWMVANLALLSRADLSYVLPVTSMSYIFIALLGQFLLHEQVNLTRWIGIVVVTLGIMLVGKTPARTTPRLSEED